MRVTLEFEDRNEAVLAMMASEMQSAMLDVDQMLRNAIKHDGDLRRVAHECRDVIGDVLSRCPQ
jgi:hypothetical protein